jgi:hypothetical protein
MRVTKPMGIMTMEDIAAFAEARGISRLVRDVTAAAPRSASAASLEFATTCAAALLRETSAALRAGHPEEEMKRFDEAEVAALALRAHAWDMYCDGALAAPMFDELMTSTCRLMLETQRLRREARQRALARIR